MRDLFLLSLAIAFFFISGRVLVHFIDREDELGLGLFQGAAISFMLGLGAISLQMFIYSVISIPFNIPYIIAPWVPLSAYALLSGKAIKPSKRERNDFLSEAGFVGIFLLAVIASQVIYAFLYGPMPTISAWDSFQTWFFKANAFFKDKGVTASFFNIPLAHPDYPLLIPLSAAWVYTCLGHINDELVRVIYPLQYLSLLIIFYYLVKKAASTRSGLLFTALLSITPILMVHAAGLPVRVGELYTEDFVGYADLALSAYFVAAGGFFYLYVIEGKTAQLVLTALFLGLGAWTKDEGFVFALLGGAVFIAHLISSGKTPFKKGLSFALILAAVMGPWVIYKMVLKIPGEYERSVTLSTFTSNLKRLPAIFRFMKFILFEKVALYNFTWYAYVAANIVNWRGAFRRPLLFVNMIIIGQISVYIFIYIITFLDLDFHLKTSFDRLALQLVPLAIFTVAINLSRFIDAKTLQKKNTV